MAYFFLIRILELFPMEFTQGRTSQNLKKKNIYIYIVLKNGVKTKIEPHSSHLKVYLFMSGE